MDEKNTDLVIGDKKKPVKNIFSVIKNTIKMIVTTLSLLTFVLNELFDVVMICFTIPVIVESVSDGVNELSLDIFGIVAAELFALNFFSIISTIVLCIINFKYKTIVLKIFGFTMVFMYVIMVTSTW